MGGERIKVGDEIARSATKRPPSRPIRIGRLGGRGDRAEGTEIGQTTPAASAQPFA